LVAGARQATCLLAAPPALWQRVAQAPLAAGGRRAGASAAHVSRTPGPGAPAGGGASAGDGPGAPDGGDPGAEGEASAGGGAGVLAHVRFSFDRAPLRRMHAALAEAATRGADALRLLPVRCPSRARGGGVNPKERSQCLLGGAGAPVRARPRPPSAHPRPRGA